MTKTASLKIGVHTSVRNGFVGALDEALQLHCTAFQMFSQNPRGWKSRVYTDAEFQDFRTAREKSVVDPVVVHAPYLPNLCTSDAELYQKSVQTLKDDLSRCEKLAANYLVIHPGSYSPDHDPETGIAQIVKAFNDALKAVPGQTKILIENMAGGGRRMGGPFREIKEMLSGVKDKDRMGVCFDTCHALAAGYDISHAAGVEKTLDEGEKEFGLDQIHVFHVNDSKGECGSHRDRHEHLGKGHVGINGLTELLSHKEFSNCAFILETPKDSPKADPQNLTVLRSCITAKPVHN